MTSIIIAITLIISAVSESTPESWQIPTPPDHIDAHDTTEWMRCTESMLTHIELNRTEL